MSRLGHSFLIIIPLTILVATGYWLYRSYGDNRGRASRAIAWIRDPQAHPELMVNAGVRCGLAPFQMPTSGLIGFIWDDSFRIGYRHQGIDIFGGAGLNTTPVFAAYPGFLTRQQDWKSSLIIRIPDDPLHPGRQIWNYYTHMASAGGESYISDDFPPGAQEVFVEAATLLGYQGNYSGDLGNPVGVHLHFSIVQDDGQGHYLNELEIQNTLDPSPYLGLPLNADQNPDAIPVCSP